MNIKKIVPYIVALLIFIAASIIYFNPVLKGEKLSQSDITQFTGMAKEIQDYRAKTGEEPYWTGSAFSGMPAYQLSAYYPNDFINYVDKILRFLPRPADYLFLYFFGFFLLLIALKVDWKLAVLGSLSFGFSTYLIIIFGAGHNAKAHAIGYIPFVLAGILWIFQRKYLLGFVVTALAMALELKANHPQMTYYLMFSALILGIFELIEAVKKKQLPVFGKQVAVILVATIIGLGVNSTRLMAMKEYADFSTRGKSELTINPNGTEKEVSDGLTKEYITQFSYGIPETFNLVIPRYMGGGTFEKLSEDSNSFEFVADKIGKSQAKGFTEQVLMYWGKQPIVEAPAYIGAVLLFLFFLGIFLVKGTLKKWLVAATIFSLVLSWGKNFGIITNFFIDYVPLYNKFRAVSSIQVIAEFSVPLLAILGLKEFFSNTNSEEKLEALKKSLYTMAGVIVVGLLYAFAFSTFEGIRDNNYTQLPGLIDAVIEDRKSVLLADSFRSLVLIGIAFGLLWMFLQNKLDKSKTIIAFGIIILFDLVTVDYRYVNKDDFRSARKIEKPFIASEADKQILKDKSIYRVANLAGNPMEDGRTSYFHRSIGGYHAAKMGRYNDLIEFQIAKNNFEVFNMLNTKYFIVSGENGKTDAKVNPEANGNVWFVRDLKVVNSADEEIVALDSLPTKTKAVVERSELIRVYNSDYKTSFVQDSTAIIKLVEYDLTQLIYESQTTTNQFAVFSEIYYKNGWNAYIDGELTPYIRVNYVLRGMEIPAGKHTIEFKFEPTVIDQGNTITLISYAFLILLPIGWFFLEKRKK